MLSCHIPKCRSICMLHSWSRWSGVANIKAMMKLGRLCSWDCLMSTNARHVLPAVPFLSVLWSIAVHYLCSNELIISGEKLKIVVKNFSKLPHKRLVKPGQLPSISSKKLLERVNKHIPAESDDKVKAVIYEVSRLISTKTLSKRWVLAIPSWPYFCRILLLLSLRKFVNSFSLSLNLTLLPSMLRDCTLI